MQAVASFTVQMVLLVFTMCMIEECIMKKFNIIKQLIAATIIIDEAKGAIASHLSLFVGLLLCV